MADMLRAGTFWGFPVVGNSGAPVSLPSAAATFGLRVRPDQGSAAIGRTDASATTNELEFRSNFKFSSEFNNSFISMSLLVHD